MNSIRKSGLTLALLMGSAMPHVGAAAGLEIVKDQNGHYHLMPTLGFAPGGTSQPPTVLTPSLQAYAPPPVANGAPATSSYLDQLNAANPGWNNGAGAAPQQSPAANTPGNHDTENAASLEARRQAAAAQREAQAAGNTPGPDIDGEEVARLRRAQAAATGGNAPQVDAPDPAAAPGASLPSGDGIQPGQPGSQSAGNTAQPPSAAENEPDHQSTAGVPANNGAVNPFYIAFFGRPEDQGGVISPAVASTPPEGDAPAAPQVAANIVQAPPQSAPVGPDNGSLNYQYPWSQIIGQFPGSSMYNGGAALDDATIAQMKQDELARLRAALGGLTPAPSSDPTEKKAPSEDASMTSSSASAGAWPGTGSGLFLGLPRPADQNADLMDGLRSAHPQPTPPAPPAPEPPPPPAPPPPAARDDILRFGAIVGDIDLTRLGMSFDSGNMAISLGEDDPIALERNVSDTNGRVSYSVPDFGYELDLSADPLCDGCDNMAWGSWLGPEGQSGQWVVAQPATIAEMDRQTGSAHYAGMAIGEQDGNPREGRFNMAVDFDTRSGSYEIGSFGDGGIGGMLELDGASFTNDAASNTHQLNGFFGSNADTAFGGFQAHDGSFGGVFGAGRSN